jgi:hypothetical protein
MKSLFETETITEIEQRILSLTPNTERQWGTMHVSQMVKHCQVPLEIAMGKKQPKEKVGLLKKTILKLFKSSLYNDKPIKKNLPTGKDFYIKDRVDFDSESEKLLALAKEFHNLKNKTDWNPHPFFGELTKEQWGKSQYKHLDHHLKQFGV